MLNMFDNKGTEPGSLNKDGLHSVAHLSRLSNTKWAATLFLMQEGVLNKPEHCQKCGGSVGWKRDPFLTEVKFEWLAASTDVDVHTFFGSVFTKSNNNTTTTMVSGGIHHHLHPVTQSKTPSPFNAIISVNH